MTKSDQIERFYIKSFKGNEHLSQIQDLRSTPQFDQNWSNPLLLHKEFYRKRTSVPNPGFEVYIPLNLTKSDQIHCFYIKSFIGNEHLSQIQDLRFALPFGIQIYIYICLYCFWKNTYNVCIYLPFIQILGTKKCYAIVLAYAMCHLCGPIPSIECFFPIRCIYSLHRCICIYRYNTRSFSSISSVLPVKSMISVFPKYPVAVHAWMNSDDGRANHSCTDTAMASLRFTLLFGAPHWCWTRKASNWKPTTYIYLYIKISAHVCFVSFTYIAKQPPITFKNKPRRVPVGPIGSSWYLLRSKNVLPNPKTTSIASLTLLS